MIMKHKIEAIKNLFYLYEVFMKKRNKKVKAKTTYLHDKTYLECVYDILQNEKVESMDRFMQHGKTTTLSHSIGVSYISYRVCRKWKLDFASAARAGLLHDFYLYDWHVYVKESTDRFHGLTHPRKALYNAEKEFIINKKEKNIILRHMWPLTPIPPRTLEGFVVVFADKYCGILEIIDQFRKPVPAILS